MMRRWHYTLPQGTDPARWLPDHLFYSEHRELCMVQSPRATWGALQQALAYAQTRQLRASSRGHLRAYRDHTALVEQLRVVLDTFAPLMAAYPDRTFGEACQVIRLGPGQDPRKVVKEL